jgi:N-acetylmuramidase
MAISQEQFIAAASRLNVEVAAIKAVAKVESRGEGFTNGKLTILFEPHIFWKQLVKQGIDPKPWKVKFPNLLNPIWDKTLYGSTASQWDKLMQARTIDAHAANMSASYGAFQIMGFNYTHCGFASVESFISFLEQGVDKHLDTFCTYIVWAQLVDELRLFDWAGFARGYNGPQYWQNQYDTKLKRAYEFFKLNP